MDGCKWGRLLAKDHESTIRLCSTNSRMQSEISMGENPELCIRISKSLIVKDMVVI